MAKKKAKGKPSKQGDRKIQPTTDATNDRGVQPEKPLSQTPKPDRFTIVGIGASAGGLAALKEFFTHVPNNTDFAFVVVVHLAPEHKSHLAELLQPHVKMPVAQVTTTVSLERNHVYVIPPNANLDTIDTHLRLTELEERRQERAPIDHFFRTLAKTHDSDSIGIILTGTGSDGTLGLREIKERGGLAVVQDPNEAEYDGMPQSAIATGIVDIILPLTEIPDAVLRYARTHPKLDVTEDDKDVNGDDTRLLQRIFAQLHARTGRDFSRYKRSTIMRRIQRRMQLRQIEELPAYLDMMREHSDEVRALADDLLITVTSFFRDREVFEKLEKEVIPTLFEGKGPEDEIRIWSVGCATGEEAYSLAILLLEEAGRRDSQAHLQIFASDLHEHSLKRAREGFFPGDIETDVSPDRLKRFFVKEDGGYRVRKEVREAVLFAPHNLFADPPFSRIDLVACRNVLIYIQREVQREVVEIFHYALRPNGLLLLGTSETVDAAELFRILEKKACLYRKRNVQVPEPRLPVFPLTSARAAGLGVRRSRSGESASYGDLHHLMLERYALPSALISPEDKIVHLSENAGRYLLHPGGEPTAGIYRLVRDELQLELRTIIHAARAEQEPKRSKPVLVRFNGDACPVVVHARPALEQNQEGYVLLIFDERAGEELPSLAVGGEASGAATKRKTRARESELERELDLSKQRLQAIIEEYETSQEEMKASNEEMQSTNEELRSTMEELETSKEELQSMNEELQTVNQEHRHKVEELAQLSSDLQNLLGATDIATLFLDRELRILRFTPKVGELFNVRLSDRSRPITDLTQRLGYDDLAEDAKQVLARLVPLERELGDGKGRWYLTRVIPYRTAEDRIDGIVITFVDISARKTAEIEIREAKEYAEQIIATLPEPLLVLTPDLHVKSANAAFYEEFQVQPAHTEGMKIYDLGNGQWNIPALRKLLEDVLPDNHVFNGYEVSHDFERLGHRVMLLNARRLEHLQLILLGIHDITARHTIERQLKASEERLQKMVNIEGIGVLAFDATGALIDANDAFLDMFGYSREDLATRSITWRTMTPPEYVAASEQQLEKLATTGRIGPYEKEYLRKDGSRSWMLFVGASLGDKTIVEYCIDISDRKRIEESLRHSEGKLAAELAASNQLHDLSMQLISGGDFQSLYEQVLDAAVGVMHSDFASLQMLDDARDAGIQDDGALRLLAWRGFSPQAVEYWQSVSLDSVTSCGQALRTGQRVIIGDIEQDSSLAGSNILNEYRGAGIRSMQSTPLMSRSGRVLGMISTHWAKPYQPSESELHTFDVLARQAADFVEYTHNAASAKLADQRKDEFLATLAHELRNPLAPIASGLQLLKMADDKSSAFNEIHGTLERQTKQLVALVDDLLDVSRITSGKLNLRICRVPLADVLQSAVEASQPFIDKEHHELTVNAPAESIDVMADPNRLAQIISNLLNNAAKYTPDGGHIALSARQEGSDVVIAVADTGMGLPPEMIDSVFEMFTQVDSQNEKGGTGLGIGLTLVKSLVEMHGGTVDVRSEGLNQGCEFVVRLPIVVEGSSSKSQSRQRDSDKPSAPRRKVLIVDDNQDAGDILGKVIELLGNEVRIARDGQQALDVGAEFHPDVILMDLGMPKMNGYEAALLVRQQEWSRGLCLVALTGWGQEDDRRRTREAGFDEHLVKPADITALQELFAKLPSTSA